MNFNTTIKPLAQKTYTGTDPEACFKFYLQNLNNDFIGVRNNKNRDEYIYRVEEIIRHIRSNWQWHTYNRGQYCLRCKYSNRKQKRLKIGRYKWFSIHTLQFPALRLEFLVIPLECWNELFKRRKTIQ